MTPLVIRYPFDKTGVSASNLISGEEHTMPNRRIRAVVLHAGAYFTESLILRDKSNNRLLVEDVDYYPAEFYPIPSQITGKQVCAIIIIKNETVGSTITAQYQAVGGEWSTSVQAIINQIERLNLDDRPVSWPAIINKPEEGYPAAHHLHDAGDIHGFEYVVHSLEKIRSAILLGDVASHDEIYAYIDSIDTALRALIASQGNAITSHVNDRLNPHQVTAAQTGAYTKAETDTRIATINTALTTHVNNKTNPHNVTAAQTGAYTKTETDTAIGSAVNPVSTALTSHVNNKLNPHQVTAAQVGAYTKAEVDGLVNPVSTALSAHVNNKLNPHQVTAAQVGAYTKSETDGLIGPVSTSLTNHINNTANPHNVTAAQTGAYTKAEVNSITNGINSALSAHVGRTDNPHGVTAAQLNAYTKTEVDSRIATVQNALTAHVNRTDNPHNVTAAQLNVYTKTETDSRIGAVSTNLTNHVNNTNNPHNVTAAQLNVYTKTEVDSAVSSVRTLAQNHISATGNVHGMTKADIGLGSVVNHGIATDAEAAAYSSTKYATPNVAKVVVDTRMAEKIRLNAPSNTYPMGPQYFDPTSMAWYAFADIKRTVSNAEPGSAFGYQPGHLWFVHE